MPAQTLVYMHCSLLLHFFVPPELLPTRPFLPCTTLAAAGGVSVQYLTDSHMPIPHHPSPCTLHPAFPAGPCMAFEL